LRQELAGEGDDGDPRPSGVPGPEEIKLLLQMPITFGFSIKNPATLAAGLAFVKTEMKNVLPGGVDWEPLQEPYKDVQIVRIRPRPNREVNRLFGNSPDAKDPLLPTVYYALIDGGFYLSLVEAPLKQLIDASVERKKGEKGDGAEVNSSLYLSPRAAESLI